MGILCGGVQCSADFCRMVRVIVDDVDAVSLSLIFKAPVSTAESQKSRGDCLVGNVQKIGKSNSGKGIQNIVVSVYMEGKFPAPAVFPSQEKRREAGFVVSNLRCAVITAARKSVGDNTTGKAVCDLFRMVDVAVYDEGTVSWQKFRKRRKECRISERSLKKSR